MQTHENIVIFARELAAKYNMSVDQALDVIRIEILQRTLEAATSPQDDPRVEDLQKDVQAASAEARQAQEWIRQLRGGLDHQDGRLDALTDAVQSLITKQSEQAQTLVRIGAQVGLD